MSGELFRHDRAIPPEWRADLYQLGHPSDRLSWLELAWLPGLPYEPVQRWAIYECQPAQMVELAIRRGGGDGGFVAEMWDALRGPDPRTVGRWVPDPTVLTEPHQRWDSDSLVSRTQWDLYQRTQAFPRLVWIIEGTSGGHAWQIGNFERAFLKLAGLDVHEIAAFAAAWPDPGSQAYAPYDGRVFSQLTQRDRLAKWRQSIAWDDRRAIHLVGDRQGRQVELAKAVLAWLELQVHEFVDEMPRSVQAQVLERAPVTPAPAIARQHVNESDPFTD